MNDVLFVAFSDTLPSLARCWNPCACGLLTPVCPLMKPNSRSRAEPRKSSPPLYEALFSAGTYVDRSSTAVSGWPASVDRYTIGWPESKPLTNSMSTQDSWNEPEGESVGFLAMWMPSTRSAVLVWVVTSNGPLPTATIGALYTVS